MEILLFTGWSASGKSTLADRLNQSLNYQFIKEREILRKLARDKGYQRTRHWLAQEGPAVLMDAARSETINLLKQLEHPKGVIIDGVYDRLMTKTIKQNFPGAILKVIAVTIEEDIRMRRMAGRIMADLIEANKESSLIDNFKREAGIEELIKEADLIIDNNGSLDASFLKLRTLLKLNNDQ